MKIGYLDSVIQNIPIKTACRGYYLRWYYNGWHYWFFLPGELNMISEGENYRTIGTRVVTMGSGQVTEDQIQAIRTILNTREVSLLTSDGWKNIKVNTGSVITKKNYFNGYEIEIKTTIGSKDISETGYSPIRTTYTEIPCDYFMPSQDETLKMWENLYKYGVGNFKTGHYWASTETSATHARRILFDNIYSLGSVPKGDPLYFRPCRVFTAEIGKYKLRDTGPGGGLICYITGTTYYEAYSYDLELAAWSSVTNIAIGTTSTAIGAGQSNTDAVIAQHGSTGSSAAKDCNDFCLATPDVCETIIGTQIWACKNYDSNYPGSKVWHNNVNFESRFGRIYTYSQIMASGFCPPGWHIPTLAEWEELVDFCGGWAAAGGVLKEIGLTNWLTPNTAAVDTYDFAARGAGYYDTDFVGYKEIGYFWTADQVMVPLHPLSAYAAMMTYDTGIVVYPGIAMGWYLPVRLIKDTDAPPVIYDDWFSPSVDELNKIYVNLHSGTDENLVVYIPVGGFSNVNYWTSSERNATSAYIQNFTIGTQSNDAKGAGGGHVRACRSFTAGIGAYSLRDTGPSGGLIFYIDGAGTTYYEVPPSDQSANYVWSGQTAVAVTGTGTAIGTGLANTNLIIAQPDLGVSAARLCNDLVT